MIEGEEMDKNLWTAIFFYGSVIILVIAFVVLVNKRRLKELIPIGLFIAAENYTLELIGLHYGYWNYPLESTGYPEVTIISSLVFFPVIAMLFYQYLSKNVVKNIILVVTFVTANMVIEIITLRTTNLFVYGKGMNLFVALLIYTMAYILIILFGKLLKELD